MVKSKLGISIILQVLAWFSYQTIAAQHGDCSSAIEVNQVVYTHQQVNGHGRVMEISGNRLGDKFAIEHEHHTVWYRISIPADGVFTFTLTGNSNKEDWDFVLYKSEANSDCKSIVKSKPVRSNLARNGKDRPRETGLGQSGKQKYVSAGIQPMMSKPLEVKKGEVYYLLTDEARATGGGHRIEFEIPQPMEIIVDTLPQDTVRENQDSIIQAEPLQITLFDQITRDSLTGRISVKFQNDSTVKDNHTHRLGLDVVPKESIEITSFAKGFLINTSKYTMPASGQKEVLKIYLKPLKEGGSVNLTDIRFKGNKAEILPSSAESLENLLKFLQLNSNIKVEIQGHVNGPYERNTRWFRKLSRDRAAAIKDFLIDEGVERSRLKSKGYGNKKMIYPTPSNEAQSTANRRVEIKVLEID